MFAGPNGSGKSTVTKLELSQEELIRLDELIKTVIQYLWRLNHMIMNKGFQSENRYGTYFKII